MMKQASFEERYQTILESIEEIVYALKTPRNNPFGGTFLFVSDPVRKLLGYEPKDFLNAPDLWFRSIHPDDAPIVVESLQRMFAVMEGGPMTYRLKHRDTGEYRWIEDHVSLHPDDAGDAVMVLGVARDITERRRAEQVLQQSEERYRTLVETAPEVIYTLSMDGAFTSLNRVFERVTGWPRDQWIGRPFTDIIHPDDVPLALEKFQQLRGGEAVRAFELRVLTNAGDPLIVEFIAGPQMADGTVTGVFGFARNITGRKRAEAALRESESAFRTLAETVAAGIYICRGTRYIYVNAMAESLTGYSRDELLTMDIGDIIHPDHRQMVKERAAARQRGEAVPSRYEIKTLRKNEEVRWMDVTASVMALQGQPAVLVSAFDITERKALEAQLLQAQKLESLGTLAGGIAHDFNNMLTGILGFTQLLSERVDPTSEIAAGLRRVDRLGQRAADMIRQLLTFSRKEVTEKTSLSLHPLLKEIGKLLGRTIPENIEIDLGLDRGDLRIEADPTQLHQVMMNLAINARDAMPQGGRLTIETARVQLSEGFCQSHAGLEPGWYARLSVSDTGTGIPAEIRDRIFDPFFTTKEDGKGTGLGLAVVYGIVKNHGGAIDLDSETGRGTVFHVYLPLTEKQAEVETLPAVRMTKGDETILLAEDEPVVLELGQMALEHFGYRVLTARDGQEAIEVYKANHEKIALVILDVVMPRVSGWEAFQEMKRLNPHLKVLMATGYDTDRTNAEQWQEAGACGLVRKPFQVHRLVQIVQTALGQATAG
jgi:PAS domain S-box-containing protein